jgi:hypothetical protein
VLVSPGEVFYAPEYADASAGQEVYLLWFRMTQLGKTHLTPLCVRTGGHLFISRFAPAGAL